MTSLKKLLVFSLVITGLTAAHGANVAFTTSAAGPAGVPPKKKIVTSGLDNVATSSIVRLGFFNLPGGDTTILSVGLFAALQAIFTPVGEDGSTAADGNTGPIRMNASGEVVIGSIQNISDSWIPTATAPDTTPLYAWVFNQATPDATATQWTIFRDPSWVMPVGIGSINLQTWQIDSPTEVYRGTLDAANNQIIMADIVPEPTSAVLGMIGLGLTLRRRRA